MKKMTPKDIIAGADKLLTEKSFTTGASARTKDNNVIGPTEANAVKFCFVGALRRVAGDPLVNPDGPNKAAYIGACDILYKHAQKLYNTYGLATINDQHGYAAVKKVFAAALKGMK